MIKITDYNKVFEILVDKTAQYVTTNNLKAMILGISGGIDSTVVAAICHKVSKRTNIPLIGRSLPTKYNKEGETTTADLVGKAFCTDYKVFNMDLSYRKFAYDITFSEGFIDTSGPFDFDKKLPKQTNLANGNIQARLRMIYLYNLASIYGGLVMDTDNLTENNLGYFTIHGDVGDFNPIGGLWKTEIFELAEWLKKYYWQKCEHIHNQEKSNEACKQYVRMRYKYEAIRESIKLKPTAGLGITNNDLEEIGAESYDQVDRVLQCLTDNSISTDTIDDIPDIVLENIVNRHNASKFKRKQLPIKIDRVWLQ
jgi:NAD+ synthetase